MGTCTAAENWPKPLSGLCWRQEFAGRLHTLLLFYAIQQKRKVQQGLLTSAIFSLLSLSLRISVRPFLTVQFLLLPSADTDPHPGMRLASPIHFSDLRSKSKIGPSHTTLSPLQSPSGKNHFWLLGPSPQASHFIPKQLNMGRGRGLWRARETTPYSH